MQKTKKSKLNLTYLSTTSVIAMGCLLAAPAYSTDLTRIVDGKVTTVTTTTFDGDGKSGFEILSGIATIDGGGDTFTGFQTSGGAGSGGGAGLGGVFFVNSGATLNLSNANIEGNIAVGGEGGGGGSASADNAIFEASDKLVKSNQTFILGSTYEIQKNGSDYTVSSITYGDSAPSKGIIDGATISFSGNTNNAKITSSSETGLSFDTPIDISDYVTPISTEGLLPVLALGPTITENNVDYVQVLTGTAFIGSTTSSKLAEGVTVFGDGIPNGVTIQSVEKDDDGKVTSITLSQKVKKSSLSSGFDVIVLPLAMEAAPFVMDGKVLTFDTIPTGIEEGMTIEGDGILGTVTVESVDPDTNKVTLSSEISDETIKFDGAKPGSEVGKNYIYLPTATHDVEVGDNISGNGIPTGSTVTKVEGDRIEISSNLTSQVSSTIVQTIKVSGSTITVRSGASLIRPGMEVSGIGISNGTTVVSVAGNVVTLSNSPSSLVSGLSFVSETSTGGGMNGRGTGNDASTSDTMDGYDGFSGWLGDGNGQAGQGATHGGNGDGGAGGRGGFGGNGGDGALFNPELAYEVYSTAKEIAQSGGEAVAAAIPDPYPKPALAAALAVSVADKVISSIELAITVAKYAADAARGNEGTGGDGGSGGNGGAGDEFFGGGAGGAGGQAGLQSWGIATGDGTPGAGGVGGDGGFGAGGGAAGQAGSGAYKSDFGAGGYGGFGAGDGSAVDDQGNTSFGAGGAGYGGGIFVRDGGTLLLSGNVTLAGNSTKGGGSADASGGTAGNKGGNDLYMMKGSTVTLSAGLGETIQFESGIGDDSNSTNTGSQHAEGDGAGLEVDGQGLVRFLADNTYSGTTKISSGTLEAQDGEGIHASSHINFNGDNVVDNHSAAVLLSEGEFTRSVGFGSDQVSWTGSGGFAAGDAGLVVDLGKTNATSGKTLVWGSTNFVPDDANLTFGSKYATGKLEFLNSITSSGADINLYAIDNANSETDENWFAGNIDGTNVIVNGNSGDATLHFTGEMTQAALKVDSGTLDTTGGGTLNDTGTIDIKDGATFIAGTADTTGAVTNDGTYDVNAAQTVASLTNKENGEALIDANVTSKGDVTNAAGGLIDVGTSADLDVTGVVANAAGGTVNLSDGSDIKATGIVTNDGALNVEGTSIIDTAGFAGADTGVTDVTTKLTIDQSGNSVYAGVITGAGSLTKDGAGALNVTGANTFEGGTTVSEGTLDTTGGGTLNDTGTIDIKDGATFIAGTADTTGAVTNDGTYDVNAAQTVASLTNKENGEALIDANVTSKGDVTNAAGGLIDVGTSADLDVTGVVANAAGGTVNLSDGSDIKATGIVTNDGALNVEGTSIIDTAGFAGADTGVTDVTTKLTIDQSGNSVYAGVITGAGSLTKDGAGALNVTGANTFEGGTTVSEGTLDTTGGGTLNDTGTIDIKDGATFIAGTADTTGAVTNDGTYDVNAAQTVASLTNKENGEALIDANVTSKGDVTNAAGGLIDVGTSADLDVTGVVANAAGGTVNLSDGSDIKATGIVTNDGALNVEGTSIIDTAGFAGADTGVTDVTTKLTIDQSGNSVYAGVITGAGSLTKDGAGALNVTGANTFEGGTTVSEGTLDTTGGGTLNDTGTIDIKDGATFIAGTADTTGAVTNDGTYDVNAAQTVASLTNKENGEALIDANVTSKGDVTNAAGGLIDVGTSADLDVTGVVANAAGGTVNLSDGSDIKATGIVTNDGALNVEGTSIIDTAGFAGADTGVTDVTTKLTIDQSGNSVYAGVITGAGSLTKDGAGALNVTGANTFEGGTTVSEGTLDTTGGGTLNDTGTIDIKDGATFIAGTADTTGAVTNDGTYDVNAAQTVASLTNKENGEALIDANVTSKGDVTNAAGGLIDVGTSADLDVTGVVANAAGGTVNLSDGSDIKATGIVTNDGALNVEGTSIIDTAGFAGADTGVTDVTTKLTIDQSGNSVYAGVITGAGSLTKDGAGALNVTGANTFEGGTTVSEGTLDTTGGGTLNDTGTIDIKDGATFIAGTADTTGAVTNDGTYDVNAAQTVASLTNKENGEALIDANVTSKGDVTNAAGGLIDVGTSADLDVTGVVANAAGGTVNLSDGSDIKATGIVTNDGALNVEGTSIIDTAGFAGADTGVTDVTTKLTIDQSGNSVYAGVITGAGSLTKDGAGALNVTGANTFEGGTTVSEGTLDTTGGGTLNDTGTIDIKDGATFIAGTADTTGAVTNDGTYDVNAAQTVASLTNKENGEALIDANVTSKGDVTNAAGGLIDVGTSADLDVTGVVANAAGGTVNLSDGSDIKATGIVTNDGALNVEGTSIIDTAGFAGADTGVTDVTTKLTIDQSGNSVYAGVITGAGSLTKDGAGALNVTGANTFEGGTTVSEGTLDTTGGGTLNDTGTIDIKDGATFIAGTADTTGAVTNDGTYDVNAAQTVASLTNKENGEALIDANVTSKGDVTNAAGGLIDVGTSADLDVTGVVANAAGGTVNLSDGSDIKATGIVTNDGALNVEGTSIIDTAGFAGADTGVTDVTTKLTIDQSGNSVYAGVITGAGSLTKDGAGALILAGDENSFGLPELTITGGSLGLDGNEILSNASQVSIFDYGTLFIISGNQSIKSLDGQGQIYLNGNQLNIIENGGTFFGEIKNSEFEIPEGAEGANTPIGSIEISSDFNFFGNMQGKGLLVDGTEFTFNRLSSGDFTTANVEDGTLHVIGDAGNKNAEGVENGLTVSGQLTATECGNIHTFQNDEFEEAIVSAGSILVSGECSSFSGTGYIESALTEIKNGAILAPGQSPGVLQFSGDLTLDNATANMEIGGLTAGSEHDIVLVGGEFTIANGSELNISSVNGFEMTVGESVDLFEFDVSKKTGTFDILNSDLNQNLVYSANTGVITSIGDAKSLSELVGDKLGGGQVASVIDQLGITAGTGISSYSGGYLIPLLAGAKTEAEQLEVFSRFTPEAYGGLVDFAYQQTTADSNLVTKENVTNIDKNNGNFGWNYSETSSNSSETLSDYTFTNSAMKINGAFPVTDKIAIIADLELGSTSMSTENTFSASGTGATLGVALLANVYETDTSTLALSLGATRGRYVFDGKRFALASTVEFENAEVTSTTGEIGLHLVTQVNNSNLYLYSTLGKTNVEGFSIGETGGDLNDQLNVEASDFEANELSLGAEFNTPVTQSVSLNIGGNMHISNNGSDYSIVGQTQTDDASFDIITPGIGKARVNANIGVDKMFENGSLLSFGVESRDLFQGNPTYGVSLSWSASF